MNRPAEMWKVVAGIAGIVVCLALTAYYAAAASGHPRVKHMILFLALAGVSGLVVWFSMPPRDT